MSVNIRKSGSLVNVEKRLPKAFAKFNTEEFELDPLDKTLRLSAKISTLINKLFNKPEDADKVLTANGDGTVEWKVAKGGHDMYKTVDELPKDEHDYIDIPDDDDHVMSAHAIMEIANTKEYTITYEAKISDGNNNGIGTWYEDDPEVTPWTEADTADWIGASADESDISDLLKRLNGNNVELKLLYETDRGEKIYNGGWCLDTTLGRMCIKFGSSITRDALIGIKLIVTTLAN